jgi:hypothetical protein
MTLGVGWSGFLGGQSGVFVGVVLCVGGGGGGKVMEGKVVWLFACQ